MKQYFLILFSLIALCANADNKYYAIEGILGDNIKFTLDLEEDEYWGHIAGEVTYYRQKSSISKIKIYGQAYDEPYEEGEFHTLYLKEFLGTKICGNWKLIFYDGNFSVGNWELGDKFLDMNQVIFHPITEPHIFLHPHDIADAKGVYKFSYDSGNEAMPEYGGTLQLNPAYKGNLAYTVCQVTPNIAEVQNTVTDFWDHSFYIATEDDIYYRVSAYDGVVFVVHINPDDSPSDEFGAHSDIVGAYVASDEPLSEEILHAYDEEEAFSKAINFSIFSLNDLWYNIEEGETTFPDELLLKDIDGDGKAEIIARYIPDKTEFYEVEGKRSTVFAIDDDGDLIPIISANGDREEMKIANGYVIVRSSNERGTRITEKYIKLEHSCPVLHATKTEANINSFTIEDSFVEEKAFLKKIKIKHSISIDALSGWQTIPGNQKRNENAARG